MSKIVGEELTLPAELGQTLTCEREVVQRSPRWCAKNLARYQAVVLPPLVSFVALAISAPGLPSWGAGLAIVFVCWLGMTFLKRWSREILLPLDLPPYEWRRTARQYWGSVVDTRHACHGSDPASGRHDATHLFRCPGCDGLAAEPAERVRYRCMDVEYEVRGMDLWVVCADPDAAHRSRGRVFVDYGAAQRGKSGLS